MHGKGCWRSIFEVRQSCIASKHHTTSHPRIPILVQPARQLTLVRCNHDNTRARHSPRFIDIAKSDSHELERYAVNFLGRSLVRYYIVVMLSCQLPLLNLKSMNARLELLYAKVNPGPSHKDLDKHNDKTRHHHRDEILIEGASIIAEKQSETKSAWDNLLLLVSTPCGHDSQMTEENMSIQVMSTFLPEIQWLKPSDFVNNFQKSRSKSRHMSNVPSLIQKEHEVTMPLNDIEDFLGYKFRDKSLLTEAVTYSKRSSFSYERLEFFGDMILEQIVTRRLVQLFRSPDTHPFSLTTSSFAFLNRHILGFLAFDLEINTNSYEEACENDSSQQKRLVDYIRYKPAMAKLLQRKRAEVTYQACCLDIRQALEHGDAFPWILLQSIELPKTYSDIIESLAAAIYIDSGGDLGACEKFLERLGLMKILMRCKDQKSFDLKPPTRHLSGRLGHLGRELEWIRKSDRSTTKGDHKFTACLKLNGTLLAKASSTSSASHADNLVAEVALVSLDSKLRTEKEEL